MSKILLIDDEAEICDFLQDFFQNKNYDTEIALSGEDALKKIDKYQPDVCLLDIKMPGMSGIELLKIMREKYAAIKIVMLSAVDNKDMIEEALKLGAANYLVKPLDLEALDNMF